MIESPEYNIYPRPTPTCTVTVNCADDEGNMIQPSTRGRGDYYGSPYTVDTPEIEGYTFGHIGGDTTPAEGGAE